MPLPFVSTAMPDASGAGPAALSVGAGAAAALPLALLSFLALVSASTAACALVSLAVLRLSAGDAVPDPTAGAAVVVVAAAVELEPSCAAFSCVSVEVLAGIILEELQKTSTELGLRVQRRDEKRRAVVAVRMRVVTSNAQRKARREERECGGKAGAQRKGGNLK